MAVYMANNICIMHLKYGIVTEYAAMKSKHWPLDDQWVDEVILHTVNS